MGDWLASADDPFLASSSTVLPNRMEGRTGYSPLSMGRKEFEYVGRSPISDDALIAHQRARTAPCSI